MSSVESFFQTRFLMVSAQRTCILLLLVMDIVVYSMSRTSVSFTLDCLAAVTLMFFLVMNLSHVITDFSFGPYFPDMTQPLKNTFELTHERMSSPPHNLKN